MNLNASLSAGQSAMESAQQNRLIESAAKQKTSAGKSPDFEKIHELSQQFESVFMEIVMKSMRSTISKSDFVDGGNAEDIYKGMLDSEYAKIMSNSGSSGLAQDIERQLLQNLGIKQPIGRLTKESIGRANYSSQTLRREVKQATINSKG